MKAKLEWQKKARLLRQKGNSINEICRNIGAAKSSVSEWVRDISLSPTARARIESRWTRGQHKAQEARREHTRNLLAKYRTYAVEEYSSLQLSKIHKRLLVAMMYWCEGAKEQQDRRFTFTNSDPALVGVFLKLLRAGFVIDESKFSVCVHLHDYHDAKRQLLFWSRTTNIPLSQFIKPYRKHHTGKRKREGYQGCASINYHDVTLSREILALARVFLQHSGL